MLLVTISSPDSLLFDRPLLPAANYPLKEAAFHFKTLLGLILMSTLFVYFIMFHILKVVLRMLDPGSGD